MGTPSLMRTGWARSSGWLALAVVTACGGSGCGSGTPPDELTCTQRDDEVLAIEEGAGEPTAIAARDVWPADELPRGLPEVERERRGQVEWLYVDGDDATGTVTVVRQAWGLWHVESIVRCR
jgi:hypothetical protein